MTQFESKSLLLNEFISAAVLFITFQRLHYFEMCLLLCDFFSLSTGSHSVVFVSTNEKRLQNHVYRQIKNKLMDICGSVTKVNPWNRLTSLYIISYLHVLKLNKILTLPQTFLFITEAGFGLIQMMFTLFFACQI